MISRRWWYVCAATVVAAGLAGFAEGQNNGGVPPGSPAQAAGPAAAHPSTTAPQVAVNDAGTTEVLWIEEPEDPPLAPEVVSPPRPYKDYEYSRLVSLREVEPHGKETVLEFSAAVDDPSRLPNRANYLFWLAGPPRGGMSAIIEDAEWMVRTADGLTSGPFEFRQTTDFGRIADAAGVVQLTEVDQFRSASLYRAEMLPVTLTQTPPTVAPSSSVAYLTKARIRVKLPEGAQQVNLAQRDPYLKKILDLLVANPSQADFSTVPLEPLKHTEELAEWNKLLEEAAARGPLLLAKLPRGGLYTINNAVLQEAGIAPEELPVDRIRLFIGKEEAAPVVQNVGVNNLLVGQARLVFYVPHDETDREPYMPLWIMLGELGKDVPRSQLLPPADRVVSEQKIPATTKVTIFEPKVYNHMLPLTGPQLRWATQEVPYRGTASFEFEARAPRAEGQVQIRAWVTALQNAHAVEYALFLNGTEVASGTSRGIRMNEINADAPGSLLREGTNVFAIYNRESDKATDGAPMAFVSATLTLPTTTVGALVNQPITLAEDGATTLAMLLPRPHDLSSMAIVADVTDPLKPRYYPASRAGTEAAPSYRTSVDAPSAMRRFVFSPDNALLSVVNIERTGPPRSFLDTNPVDYLAIAHGPFLPDLKPLLDHRQRQRRIRTAAYSVQDVYNAFSYGAVSYRAIHDAIYHAFTAREGTPLNEVLLVGEGSEHWWQYRRSMEGVSENMLPVFGWQDPGVTIRGDDGYARLVGKGPLADVEIGRMSVTTGEELATMVRKSLNYENSPPVGPWMTRHLFVSDDEPEFDQVVSEIVDKTISGPHLPEYLSLKEFPYEDYFRGYWRKRSSLMTDTLLKSWAEGALTITYMGHGGPNLWSGERILHIRDVDNIEDGGRHPILVAGSCDTGWVDYPVEPVRSSLSEHLTRRPGGGAVAAFIPIDGTSSFEHNFLLTAFFDALINREQNDVGTMSLLSKIGYHLPRNNGRVTDQYLLMGDPALLMPRVNKTFPLNVQPARLIAGQGGKLAVSGEVPGLEWGMVDLRVLGADHKEITRQRVRVLEGAFTAEIDLPLGTRPGTHRVVAVATNEEQGICAAADAQVEVHDANVTLRLVSDVPLDKPHDAGTTATLTVSLLNRTGMDLSGAVLEVVEAAQPSAAKVLLSETLNLPVGADVTRKVAFAVPAGASSLRARLLAQAPNTTPVAPPLAQEEVTLVGREQAIRYVDVLRTAVKVRSIADPRGTRFELPIYNTFTHRLNGFGLRLRREGAPEGEYIGGIRRLDGLEPGQRRRYVFDTEQVFEPGVATFHLEFYDLRKEQPRLIQTNVLDVDLTTGPDLQVVADSFILETEKPREGTTVFARFRVRNAGPEPARQVRAMLYLGAPWQDAFLVPNSVPWAQEALVEELAPGEEKEFRLRWDPSGTRGTTRLFAAVSSGTPEVSLANNVVEKQVDLIPPANIAILTDQLQVSHQLVQPYDRVSISVPVKNTSDQDFLREFKIAGSSISPSKGKNRQFSRRFESLKAGETVMMQFEWLVQPGETAFEINANEDREYKEENYEDNVYTVRLPYVFSSAEFPDARSAWDYRKLIGLAEAASVSRDPSGYFRIVRRPSAVMTRVPFRRDYLVEGEMGPGRASDGLWGEYENGVLALHTEFASPIKFRLPLPAEDATTYYDLYLESGRRLPNSTDVVGLFRYRVEEEEDWRVETGAWGQDGYLGRIDTRDDNVVIEAASTDVMSQAHLIAVRAAAVQGVLTSPVVKGETVPQGRAVLDEVNEGSSRIDLAVRYGVGTNVEIKWSKWLPVVKGGVLPEAPAGAEYFQWRATLVAQPDGEPSLRNIVFETRPGSLPEAPQEKQFAAGGP